MFPRPGDIVKVTRSQAFYADPLDLRPSENPKKQFLLKGQQYLVIHCDWQLNIAPLDREFRLPVIASSGKIILIGYGNTHRCFERVWRTDEAFSFGIMHGMFLEKLFGLDTCHD